MSDDHFIYPETSEELVEFMNRFNAFRGVNRRVTLEQVLRIKQEESNRARDLASFIKQEKSNENRCP